MKSMAKSVPVAVKENKRDFPGSLDTYVMPSKPHAAADVSAQPYFVLNSARARLARSWAGRGRGAASSRLARRFWRALNGGRPALQTCRACVGRAGPLPRGC
jgi:hypothetical protein